MQPTLKHMLPLLGSSRLVAPAVFASSGAFSRIAAGVRAFADKSKTPEATPGSRTRSVHQEHVYQKGPETTMKRSPDAPADPADLQYNTGSNPEEVLRTAAWKGNEVYTGGPDNLRMPNDDQSRDPRDQPSQSLGDVLGHMAEGAMDKVKDYAQQASDTVTGTHRDEFEEAAKRLDKQEGIDRNEGP